MKAVQALVMGAGVATTPRKLAATTSVLYRRFSSQAGRAISCRAAIAWEAGKPLDVSTIEVAPPRGTEVRVKLKATGVCHTDAFTLSGDDPEGLFPTVLGHEGAGVVESVGDHVTSVQPGDHVIPLYIPECGECKFCRSGKTNLCGRLRETQGQGLMPDRTTRLRHVGTGRDLFHYMGCSTFAEYTVLPEIALCKIDRRAPFAQACLLGCGITTGYGAAKNTAKVERGSTVAVFGLGGVGLSVVQGARACGASRIIGIDVNPGKFALAEKMGATDLLNPNDHPGKSIAQVLIDMTDGGVDYSFESVGSPQLMRAALEASHKGWGVSTIIGVAGAGQEIATRPFQLVTGRTWKGTAFGGFRGRSELPQLVQQYMAGDLLIDDYITNKFPLDQINQAFDLMKQGKSIRSVIIYE